MNIIDIFFDKKFLKFISIGIMNTANGMALIFLFYNIFHFGYWGSTFFANVVASAISYILNKKYTFKYEDKSIKSIIKFSITILISYIVAYFIAQKLVIYVMLLISCFHDNFILVEYTSMIFGMCMFTFLNYLGQRFFAFSD